MSKVKENWITPTLCSLDEKVRIERGPDTVELDCTDDNLSDLVTHPQYQVGARDALGRLIRPDEVDDERVQQQARMDAAKGLTPLSDGDKMTCVDWRGIHRPFMWKVYQLQPVEVFNNSTGEIEIRETFIKISQVAGRDNALKQAHKLYEEMN